MYRTENELKLDIIISGYTEDKDKLRVVIDSLQKQLDELNRTDVSALYALGGKEDKNFDYIIKNAIENFSFSEYYVILDCKESIYVAPEIGRAHV